jgi:hypothetical protein
VHLPEAFFSHKSTEGVFSKARGTYNLASTSLTSTRALLGTRWQTEYPYHAQSFVDQPVF